jgi:hypothetical protein
MQMLYRLLSGISEQGADTKSFYRRLKGGSSMHAFADLIAKRAELRWLAKPHPQWTHQDLADALSMSRRL